MRRHGAVVESGARQLAVGLCAILPIREAPGLELGTESLHIPELLTEGLPRYRSQSF
jgi:hypothetical protein